MVKTLYYNTDSYSNNTIEFAVTLDQQSGELVLQMKGTKGQFINFFMFNKLNNELEHTVIAHEMVTGDERLVLDTRAPPTADFYFSYIYAMSSKADGIGYSKVVPSVYHAGSGVGFNISKNANNKLYSTYYNGTYRVYNGDKNPIILTVLGATIQPGDVYTDSSQYYTRKVADEIVRVDNGSYNNLSYRDLTETEKDTLIPKGIITSGTHSIQWSTASDWIPSTQYQFKTTLVYCETRDKEFHFTDEISGQKYKYNIDCMRMILPHLVNGKVSGTFIYKGAGNRNIRYVPIPLSSAGGGCDDSGLIICESDDSDYDIDD